MADLYNRLSGDNAAVLLVDHQTGLISGLVRDHTPDEFAQNVGALADTARFFDLPVVMTTSFENGPNGPILPELREKFPDAPLIARPGQINAWDNEEFVKAVEATGRRQLIIAGVVTEVCVAFPALAAVKAGYEVFVVTDASGTFSPAVRDAAWHRMAQAGVQLVSWFAVAGELQRDWRHDAEGFGKLIAGHLPGYQNVIGTYMAGQRAGQAAG
ncbi:isochorismate family cysteine hydrolase YcaC [Roseococcus sp. DSY-14]|uniref:isochorismate family cysteine hydrolase YcaC n=1 Tax=Roseococcus sp. DSY-14 TaxID=3369650 RepID=UPI00387A939C